MTEKPETKHSIFEISVEARLLYARLKEVSIGEVILYTELAAIGGRPMKTDEDTGKLIDRRFPLELYGALSTARRRAQKDDGIILDAVYGEGLKRLNDHEIVGTSQRYIDGTRRASRRASKRLACVADFDSLPAEDKVHHNTFMSLFGALAVITRAKSVKKLEGHVQQAHEQLPLVKTLEAFK
jgi:hypothetical protein